jgi:hypothetical protein
MSSINDIHVEMLRRLDGNAMKLGPISTRIALRTGVSIRAPRPDQLRDTALIQKVVAVLAEMGYVL